MSIDPSTMLAPLSYAASAIALLIVVVVAVKDSRSFANRCFIATLILLGLTEICGGLSATAGTADKTPWLMVRSIFLALTPGTCLLFSLSFARQEYRTYMAKWKFIIAAGYLFPLAIIPFHFQSFKLTPEIDRILIEFGDAGKYFYALILLISVLILANLERTLRASIGRIRWQIKFIVLGVTVICADWIYTGSQAILYDEIDASFFIIHPAALIGANFLFIWGLARSQFLKVDLYLSRSTIQYSLTTLFISLYLVILGILAYRTQFLDPESLPILSLLIMMALAGLGMLLLSDRLQEQLRRFVTRHFKRPLYDYRRIWMELTEKTSSFVTREDLCTEVAKILSRTFGILSVNIWLCDENMEQLFLAGSTVFARSHAHDLERKGAIVSTLLNTIEDQIVDLKDRNVAWADDIMASQPEYFDDYRMQYIIPLQSGGLLVGIITLNDDRVGKSPLSIEDRELLHAYSAQLSARLLQLRLSDNLRKVQEIEAFHNVTAFFVHDLKNLASRLSLTMQNLPSYFDNPEFRDDALKLIGESIAKIESTCSRLSSLKQKIELRPVSSDFNELVSSITNDIEQATRSHIDIKLGRIPPVSLDPEQMQKVFTNLVMNAHDAVRGKGNIHITTTEKDNWVIFSISDAGCGMNRQFIKNGLFRPFHSTKKKGMGIGLFHSKMIVEAHNGKIEVESEEGQGSTFRVILPVKGNLKEITADAASTDKDVENNNV